MVSTPLQYATGTDPRISARPRSPVMSTGRRGSRSTIAPAGSPTRRKGSRSRVTSKPTWNVVAPSSFSATSGMASRVTWVPNRLTVSPTQSLTKSRCFQRERSGRAAPFTRRRPGATLDSDDPPDGASGQVARRQSSAQPRSLPDVSLRSRARFDARNAAMNKGASDWIPPWTGPASTRPDRGCGSWTAATTPVAPRRSPNG